MPGKLVKFEKNLPMSAATSYTSAIVSGTVSLDLLERPLLPADEADPTDMLPLQLPVNNKGQRRPLKTS